MCRDGHKFNYITFCHELKLWYACHCYLVTMHSYWSRLNSECDTLPHSWILTFGLAQYSNYDREWYTMKSDHLRLISEILDNLCPNWTKRDHIL